MQSILLIGKDKNQLLQKAHGLAEEHSINPFDITVITKETISSSSKSTTSIGISIVREMQQKVFLKPLHGSEKAVILHDAELLTIEAQNALLKILEEPPESTTIIVTSIIQDALLPTILSRCQIIEIQETNNNQKENLDEYRKLFEKLPSLSLGEKLKIAEKVGKGKEDALEWLENVIVAGRMQMLSSVNKYPNQTVNLQTLKLLQEAHKTLKLTNTNLRLTIENFLLII